MKLHSFEQMQSEYEDRGLDEDDITTRIKIQVTHPYSVIVEASFLELDGLNEWIAINIGPPPTPWIVYGKTGYDFGFAEYFFSNEQLAQAVSLAIPNIYTIYPYSRHPDRAVKSNGYDQEIICDPNDRDAIVFKPEE